MFRATTQINSRRAMLMVLIHAFEQDPYRPSFLFMDLEDTESAAPFNARLTKQVEQLVVIAKEFAEAKVIDSRDQFIFFRDVTTIRVRFIPKGFNRLLLDPQERWQLDSYYCKRDAARLRHERQLADGTAPAFLNKRRVNGIYARRRTDTQGSEVGQAESSGS